MTAGTALSFEGVFWRPSAPAAPPLRVAHKPGQYRRLAATMLAAICALTLLFGAVSQATSINLFGTETRVAAQTDPAQVFVAAGGSETPVFIGGNGPMPMTARRGVVLPQDRYFRFDSNRSRLSGAWTRQSKTMARDEASRLLEEPLGGHFSQQLGPLAVLYRSDRGLQLRVGDADFGLDQTSAEWPRTESTARLALDTPSGVQVFEYRAATIPEFDFTAGAEEEHFDLGVFLANVIADKERASRLYLGATST